MRTFYTLIFILFFLKLSAQTNTVQGYIITNDSDTVHGFFKKFDINENTYTKFLEFLVEGELNLYYSVINKNGYYFVSKNNDEIYILEGGEKLVNAHSNTATKILKVDNNKYKRVLNYTI